MALPPRRFPPPWSVEEAEAREFVQSLRLHHDWRKFKTSCKIRALSDKNNGAVAAAKGDLFLLGSPPAPPVEATVILSN
jgi:hypothetical protein